MPGNGPLGVIEFLFMLSIEKLSYSDLLFNSINLSREQKRKSLTLDGSFPGNNLSSLCLECGMVHKLLVCMHVLPEGGAPADYSRFFSVNVWRICTSEESMVFHTLFPKVFAMISLVKIEFNNILVVALKKDMS